MFGPCCGRETTVVNTARRPNQEYSGLPSHPVSQKDIKIDINDSDARETAVPVDLAAEINAQIPPITNRKADLLNELAKRFLAEQRLSPLDRQSLSQSETNFKTLIDQGVQSYVITFFNNEYSEWDDKVWAFKNKETISFNDFTEGEFHALFRNLFYDQIFKSYLEENNSFYDKKIDDIFQSIISNNETGKSLEDKLSGLKTSVMDINNIITNEWSPDFKFKTCLNQSIYDYIEYLWNPYFEYDGLNKLTEVLIDKLGAAIKLKLKELIDESNLDFSLSQFTFDKKSLEDRITLILEKIKLVEQQLFQNRLILLYENKIDDIFQSITSINESEESLEDKLSGLKNSAQEIKEIINNEWIPPNFKSKDEYDQQVMLDDNYANKLTGMLEDVLVAVDNTLKQLIEEAKKEFLLSQSVSITEQTNVEEMGSAEFSQVNQSISDEIPDVEGNESLTERAGMISKKIEYLQKQLSQQHVESQTPVKSTRIEPVVEDGSTQKKSHDAQTIADINGFRSMTSYPKIKEGQNLVQRLIGKAIEKDQSKTNKFEFDFNTITEPEFNILKQTILDILLDRGEKVTPERRNTIKLSNFNPKKDALINKIKELKKINTEESIEESQKLYEEYVELFNDIRKDFQIEKLPYERIVPSDNSTSELGDSVQARIKSLRQNNLNV